MPEQPVIDTHVHMWDPQLLTYDWHEVVTAMNRPFLLPAYQQATSEVPVAGMVFVQCDCHPDQNRDEVAWVSVLAKQETRLRGMVAFAALEQGGQIESELAWLADQPLVKGIRRITQDEADDGFCLSDNYVAGTRLLEKYNLTCDLCITPEQLPEATELALRCPEVRFIVDHLAKPDVKGGRLDPWRANIKNFASLPNTFCKLSGVVTEADHKQWTSDDVAPYINHALDCFGATRLIYGGDWPVVTLACDYKTWFSTVSNILSSTSKEEQQAVMHDNAVSFYRLH
jgi:L-fuconolactonase